jgi:hypothetical protein
MIATVVLVRGFHMLAMFYILSQLDASKIQPGEPPLNAEYSFGLTWVIACILVALILLITFKTSKRNVLERE